jgi:hypothetical protein
MKSSGIFNITLDKFTFNFVAYDTKVASREMMRLLEQGKHPWALLQGAWDICGGSGVKPSTLDTLERKKREGTKAFGRRLSELEQEKIKDARDIPGSLWLGIGPIDPPPPRKFPSLTGASLKKMSDAKRGSRNPRSKAVRVLYPSGEITEFGSSADAARSLGISPPHLCLWLSGRMVPKEFRDSGVKVERVG